MNGTQLEFNFSRQRLAHLLGIKMEGFSNNHIVNFSNSYELLEEVVKRSKYIYQKCVKREVQYSALFSQYMESKIASFKQVLQLPFNDIKFVVCYKRDNVYYNGEQKTYPGDYYIALDNRDGGYIYLGLIYDEKINRLVPFSLMNPQNIVNKERVLKELVQNQVITIVSGKKIVNIGSENKLSMRDRLGHYDELSELTQQYDAILDVSQDARYLTGLSLKVINSSNIKSTVLSHLNIAMSSGTKVSVDKISAEVGQKLDDEMVELLNNYNQFASFDNSQGDMLSELNQLRNKLKTLDGLLKQKEELIAEMEQQMIDKTILLESQEQKIAVVEALQEDLKTLYKKYFEAAE